MRFPSKPSNARTLTETISAARKSGASRTYLRLLYEAELEVMQGYAIRSNPHPHPTRSKPKGWESAAVRMSKWLR